MLPARLVPLLLLIALPVAAAEGDPNLGEAKIHYDSGAAYYAGGHFEEAVREFKAAYELSRRPAILFNLARAETKLGREEEAIKYLKRYLDESPDAADAPSVRSEIEAREKGLTERKQLARVEAEAEQARKQAEQARKQEQAAAAHAQRAEEEVRTARLALHPRWPGWLLIAVGAATVGAGIGLGVYATHEAGIVSDGGASAPGKEAVAWGGDFAHAESLGTTLYRAGVALDVVGGALAAGGVGLLVWAMKGAAADKARAWIAPAGNGFVAGGRF